MQYSREKVSNPRLSHIVRLMLKTVLAPAGMFLSGSEKLYFLVGKVFVFDR
jgi:hypothetical protein